MVHVFFLLLFLFFLKFKNRVKVCALYCSNIIDIILNSSFASEIFHFCSEPLKCVVLPRFVNYYVYHNDLAWISAFMISRIFTYVLSHILVPNISSNMDVMILRWEVDLITCCTALKLKYHIDRLSRNSANNKKIYNGVKAFNLTVGVRKTNSNYSMLNILLNMK